MDPLQGNPYSKNPLKIVLLDARKGTPLRTIVLVGTAPKSVVDAARRAGRWETGAAPTVAKPDSGILQDFYGAEWKSLIATGDAPSATAMVVRDLYTEYRGGGGEFGDLDDFDHIDDTLPDTSLITPDRASAAGKHKLPPEEGGKLVYSDIAVYPEDTIWDLRLKIFAAAGVPPYRQHLFYSTDDGQLRLPYRVAVEGVAVVTDIRTLYDSEKQSAAQGSGTENLVAGVPVDSRFEEQKDSLTVEALDTFQKLEIGPRTFVTTAYVVDLYGVIPPLWEGGTQRRAELTAVLQDKYQFDLLYYGGSSGIGRSCLPTPCCSRSPTRTR